MCGLEQKACPSSLPPQNPAPHWLSGQAPPLPVEASTSCVRGQCCLEILFFLPGCLSWWSDPPGKGVWSLPDTHVCFKIYIFDLLAHFLTADIKENCKCLGKSKFFLDTCSSTKFEFTTNSCKEEADGMSWKYLVIFLLKFSKPYFLSLLEQLQVLRAIWKLVRPRFLLDLGWGGEGSPVWTHLRR